MTSKELKEYIKHYLEEDGSHSAILLNAPWGSGKSYFIRNELVPFLAEDGRDRCIVVSLYGLKDLNEISKSIYFETRAESMLEKKTASLVGRAIVRGVVGELNVPLSITDKELFKLYDGISLAGKLLIFEDVERSSIDILEFMGYVNSLVELDNAKVLLVSNEKEFLRVKETRTEKREDGTEVTLPVYTADAERYARIKEKTISDTLQYEPDPYTALQGIMENFSSKRLSKFTEKSALSELVKLFDECGEKNLRSFIFACQKTVDLFNAIDKSADDEFLRAVYYSNVIFSMNLKKGASCDWVGDKNVCYELGSRRYPLYRFAYDYILFQRIPTKEKLDAAYKAFKKVNLYNEFKSENDEDLNTLYHFMENKEIAVRVAVKGVEMKLQDEDKISFIEYGKIASALVCLKEALGYDITRAKELLVSNLEGKGGDVDDYLLFSSAFKPTTKDGKKEFTELKKRMVSALNPNAGEALSFEYTGESVNALYLRATAKKAQLQEEGKFFAYFNPERFARTVFSCSAAEIATIRRLFEEMYHPADKFKEDKESLSAFVAYLKGGAGMGFDKIQQLQLSHLIEEVSQIVNGK